MEEDMVVDICKISLYIAHKNLLTKDRYEIGIPLLLWDAPFEYKMKIVM
jgi:hypothetical protein